MNNINYLKSIVSQTELIVNGYELYKLPLFNLLRYVICYVAFDQQPMLHIFNVICRILSYIFFFFSHDTTKDTKSVSEGDLRNPGGLLNRAIPVDYDHQLHQMEVVSTSKSADKVK